MPERKERVLTAQLMPGVLMILYSYVRVAIDQSREDRYCLDRANAELRDILGFEHEIGGTNEPKFANLEELKKTGLDQYKFSHSGAVGIAIAMAQYLLGKSHPDKLRADTAARAEIMEMAACFSSKFVELVKKKAKLQDAKPSEVKLEDVFDAEPEEPKTAEQPKP